MNKALLRTYVRSALSAVPQSPHEITAKLQKEYPQEKAITNGRVTIILNQLYSAGLCNASGNSNTETLYYDRKPFAT